MKTTIFAPGIKASAIGRMACIVAEAIRAKGHELWIVRSESAELLTGDEIDFGVPALKWTQTGAVESAIAHADAVVYQVGNHFPYHEGCLHWLERQPGIVCLHDFFLGHLFAGWLQRNAARGTSVLRYWYGDEIARSWFRHASSADFIAATHKEAPLTEWIASQASGVIGHSGWGMDRVLSVCPGPVRVVPLPYKALCSDGAPVPLDSGGSGRMKVLTVGHVNPNKRAECVIMALGANVSLREMTTYTLAGLVQPDTRQRLEELAARHGVDVRICGEVSSAELYRLMGEADVVCCLRNPSLESASASTIEAMLSARPVIVEDAGFYAELPDDCVRKIRPEHEEADLLERLLELTADPVGRKALGERAAAWAQRTFSAENYAQQLIDIAPHSRRAILVSNTMKMFAHQLERWGGAEMTLNLPETIEPLRIFDGSSGSRVGK